MKFHFYIETSPSAFSMQASDISQTIKNTDEHVFILRQALDYKDEFKEKSNVTIINITYANFPDVVKDILHGISQKSIPSVYLHFGTGHAEDIGTILSKSRYPENKTHLRIYEDDPLSIITRNTLLALPAAQRQNAISTYAQHLQDKIYTTNENLISSRGWNSVVTYSFGKIYDTKYYSSDKTQLTEDGLSIFPLETDPNLKTILFTFPEIEAARKFVDSNTLLIIFKNDYSVRDCQANVDNIISEFRANPLNNNINKLLVWGGRKGVIYPDDLQVLTLANTIPLVFLDRCNVLPGKMAGELCTEMFLMNGNEVILTLPRMEETPLEQLTGKFACFTNTKSLELIDNDALLSPDNLRIFRCAASMGDVVFALGALTALKAQTTEKFVLIANKLYEDMASACPAVDYFWPMNSVTEGKSKLIEKVGMRDKIHILDKWEQILAPKHMSLAFLDEFESQWRESDLQPKLDLSHLDTTRVDAFIKEHNLNPAKTVLVHPNIGAPNRTWTEEGWNAVTDHMVATGWQVVIIGSDKHNSHKRALMSITNPHAISAVNAFSIMETIYFMRHCALLIACDSGPVALAGMTSIGIISIYSQIEAKNRLPFRNGAQGWNALGIDVACPAYGPCGRLVSTNPKETTGVSFAEWCPKDKTYECMRGLSGETMVYLINHFLQSDDYIPQVANA
ncbi:glycosyltransferase family 9 protein [Phytobacter diazotrophicus]|uniref:glycosyltransferase family 9 protein n=1 Tax=Phytobacter diazotrophicus TaxID=395631 RepID=UPI002FF8ECDB